MLGNHKHDILPHAIVPADSEEIPLTAVNYIEILKLTLNQNILLDKIKISCLKNYRYDRSQQKWYWFQRLEVPSFINDSRKLYFHW